MSFLVTVVVFSRKQLYYVKYNYTVHALTAKNKTFKRITPQKVTISNAMKFLYKECCKPDRITDINVVIKYSCCIYWCPNFRMNMFISNLLKTIAVVFFLKFVTPTNQPTTCWLLYNHFELCDVITKRKVTSLVLQLSLIYRYDVGFSVCRTI